MRIAEKKRELSEKMDSSANKPTVGYRYSTDADEHIEKMDTTKIDTASARSLWQETVN